MSEQQHMQGEFPNAEIPVPDLTPGKIYTVKKDEKEKQEKPLAPNSGLGAFAGH